MKSVIVIPTYEEDYTLPIILDAVLSMDAGFHVLVVDDNSPDGTGEISTVRIQHRECGWARGSPIIGGL